MNAFDRAFRGSRGDWRLHGLSVFSVAVAFVCLAATLLVVVNVNAVRGAWARTGRASVYLDPAVTEPQVAAIDRALRATEGVTSVRFVSSEDARRELGASGDALVAALPAEAFPASLEVSLADDAAAARLARMASQLAALPAVTGVETYQAWSERLGALLDRGYAAAALLALIVLAAVVSVVSSTMRLVLARRRIEIEVLKLVGATDAYVRRPFVLEGAGQGALGALAAVALVGLLYAIVRSSLDGQLGLLLGTPLTFLPWTIAAALVALGAAIGAGAAHLSLRRLLGS
ncbi:MAG: ABC transporter permease [Polyangiaceae bacterium]|nr:ABC transporter permease [Polyangiaceae bacterium]